MFEGQRPAFGHQFTRVVKTLLRNTEQDVQAPGANKYARIAGVLSMLRVPLNMARICRRWDLCELFLSHVSTLQQVIALVEEQDKREILSVLLAEAFGRYSMNFTHIPIAADASTDVGADITAAALKSCGYAPDGSSVPVEGGLGGMRSQVYNSFTILHLVGHGNENSSTPSGVWFWAIKCLAASPGQPTAAIALAALSRLLAGTRGSGTNALAQNTKTDVAKLLSLSALSDKSPNGSASVWPSLLTALVHSHNCAKGEEAPQWSHGIGTVLNAAGHMYNICGTREYALRSRKECFSSVVSHDNMAIFLLLVQSGILQTDAIALEALLNACKDLPDGSEGELRASNATRAEVVGGLLRAALLAKDSATVKRLSGYLEEMVEKASLEHSADYIEALAYATTAAYSPAAQPLYDMCLSAFRATLQAQEQDFKKQGVDADAGAAENEEGFSRHSKRLKLMLGLLYGCLEESAQATDLIAQVHES